MSEEPQARVRAMILDDATLVRALATGRLRGRTVPWRRVELRYVDLAGGRRLQVTAYDDTQAHVSNHADPAEALDPLLAEGFANWHVETTSHTHQLRLSRKGGGRLHSTAREQPVAPDRSHDRAKQRLLDPALPVFRELGITDESGRVLPNREAKYRQVDALVRSLAATIDDALGSGHLRTPTPREPLRVADLGCGNAYLTFAAHAYLAARMPVALTGVDVKKQAREHNEALAGRLGLEGQVSFVVGDIASTELPQPPEVVLALHACDTATDDALARAAQWGASVVLAAPCCHHDVSAQLRESRPPERYRALVADGILRERLADTLTDAVRASLLRLHGYRVDVVEFVGSEHTPRNTLLRAVRTGRESAPAERAAYGALVEEWSLRPRLAELLEPS